jgi:2-methylcitrate dehydratase PrpD
MLAFFALRLLLLSVFGLSFLVHANEQLYSSNNSTSANTNANNVTANPITTALSKYIASSWKTPIPPEWRALAQYHILDTLAAVVACRNLEPARLARNYSLHLSGAPITPGNTNTSRNIVTILGTPFTASLPDAVFASAMTAHAAEINDFIPSAFVQPGPSIVSIALALAQSRRLSGDAVIRAVVTGYEVAGRLPKALGNANLRKAGLANHGLGPVFGAGAAAASLLRLPEERIADVLTYCAQQASGSWQWLLDVEHIEKAFVFSGMGARAGLHAALMVEAGFRGVRDSFDNPAGWLHSSIFTGGDANFTLLTEGLGQRTELLQTGYKRYPVGGPTQPAVHGLLSLLPNITTPPSQHVLKVKIALPASTVSSFRTAAMPALNLPYLSAIILLDGRLDFIGAQSRDRMLNDTTVQALMKKIELVGDAGQEGLKGEPRAESARVIVEEVGGKKHEVFVPFVKGYPSHPLTGEEVEAKAVELMMGAGIERERAGKVVEEVRALGELASVNRLIALIER